MVTVLGRPETPAAETRLHFTLAGSAGHTIAALLASETSYRVPASDVPGYDERRHDPRAARKSPGSAAAARTRSNIPRKTSVTDAVFWPATMLAVLGMSAKRTATPSHTTMAEHASRKA
ncbi:UNVERIFIED_ORG: hypothetical protein ABIB21_000745 [Arthrobacter sp. UYEF13]